MWALENNSSKDLRVKIGNRADNANADVSFDMMDESASYTNYSMGGSGSLGLGLGGIFLLWCHTIEGERTGPTSR